MQFSPSVTICTSKHKANKLDPLKPFYSLTSTRKWESVILFTQVASQVSMERTKGQKPGETIDEASLGEKQLPHPSKL